MTTLTPPTGNRPAGYYLTGNFAPVTEEVTALDLEVIGELPAELNGRYLRNGPNPLGETDPATHHWFLGDGMVHGIRLREGRAEWYRNRFVADDEVRRVRGEAPTPGPRHGMGGGTANTNIPLTLSVFFHVAKQCKGLRAY